MIPRACFRSRCLGGSSCLLSFLSSLSSFSSFIYVSSSRLLFPLLGEQTGPPFFSSYLVWIVDRHGVGGGEEEDKAFASSDSFQKPGYM